MLIHCSFDEASSDFLINMLDFFWLPFHIRPPPRSIYFLPLSVQGYKLKQRTCFLISDWTWLMGDISRKSWRKESEVRLFITLAFSLLGIHGLTLHIQESSHLLSGSFRGSSDFGLLFAPSDLALETSSCY